MCLQASYGIEDAEFAITQLAQTTMRSEIGKIALDTVFRERELLNIAIVGTFITGPRHLPPQSDIYEALFASIGAYTMAHPGV